jgi:hypothetical protein
VSVVQVLAGTVGEPLDPVFAAADEVRAHWHAAMSAISVIPNGSREAAALKAELIRLREEHQSLIDEAMRRQRNNRFNNLWER